MRYAWNDSPINNLPMISNCLGPVHVHRVEGTYMVSVDGSPQVMVPEQGKIELGPDWSDRMW
ncbi:MAG TPA: hypothetical protein VK348_05815 [Planctomycetota bacterium]|nr:hypothetical protein [Planctomycetota bacterium]